MRAFHFRLVSIACVVVLACTATHATVPQLPRTDATLRIDGVLDEAAWLNALVIPLHLETDPGENIPARVKTLAYLMEDGTNLLVAIRAYDPDPSAIRAYLRDRDSAYDDDFAGIVIDTYNDGRRAFEFFVNPLGVQMDLTYDDVNEVEDDSWDAIWGSAGQIDAEGFVVEFRIPLKQLRFPAAKGTQNWAIDLVRMYPRDRRYRFSNNATNRGVNCYLCQLEAISGMENVQPGRDLEIVPTLTGSHSSASDEPGVIPLATGGAETDAGLTLRWGVTPDLTANIALNPDFSQIEADAAQLDVNNRFALFFPEKRPFFLEGGDYFTTPLQAVFTRTVADPNFGSKITGKRGANTFGVFAAEDAVTNLLFPGAFGSSSTVLSQSHNTFVGRYSRGFADTSSIGALLTARDGAGYHNTVGGVDGHWKINDQHSLDLQYLATDTEYPTDVAVDFEQPLTAFAGNAALARYEYDSRNWFGNVGYRRVTPGFRADSGFEPQIDVERMNVGAGRVWHGRDDTWWSRIRVRAQYRIGHLTDHTLTDRDVALRVGIGGPLQSWLQLGINRGAELADGVLFATKHTGIYLEGRPKGGLFASVFLQFADRIDYANTRLGKRVLFQPALNWNINRNLLLRVRGAYSTMETTQGEKIFDASVADLRLTWQFDRRSFLRMTLQDTVVERNPGAYIDAVDARTRNQGRQLLYAYKANPQTVFFLGYSDRYADDDSLVGLTAANRSWFMKIGYAWSL